MYICLCKQMYIYTIRTYIHLRLSSEPNERNVLIYLDVTHEYFTVCVNHKAELGCDVNRLHSLQCIHIFLP